jgi:hypothetical protein
MLIPERVNGKWMATLDDMALLEAEADLHADFRKQDAAEKSRLGTRYRLLQGSASLVNAWMRWSLVNNETTKRGLATQHRA